MNRHARTISALLRHTWAVDETWAEQHLPLLNSYLAGTLIGMGDEEDKRPIGFAMVPKEAGSYARREAQLSDETLPQNSVAILDVRGGIMKEGYCGSYGTEDYTAELNAVYANDSLIGAVILVDSGGGQLSGTPTFYDAIRHPAKPTVVLVNDGMMASAAYWLACGADYIMASQKTDQIGSIGVFCRLRDYSGAMKTAGIKEISVYSSRSKDKNKPVRDALKGDTTALEAELDAAVDHFEAAVRQGRGDKLQTNEDDEPFTGKLYYADEALAKGLIDGFGDLNDAIAKVTELAGANPTSDSFAHSTAPQHSGTHLNPMPAGSPTIGTAEHSSPEGRDKLVAPLADDQSNSVNLNNDDTMFGNKHKKLSALAGIAPADVTDEQLNEANVELDGLNITGVRVISTAYMQEADQATAALNAANAKITTLTQERDEFKASAEKFGAVPGAKPSTSEKKDEAITSGAADVVISATDQKRLEQRAKLKK